MKTAIAILAALLAANAAAQRRVEGNAPYQALRELFAAPPEAARLQAWYHWNGDCVTTNGLAADLKAMGEFGISTAHVFLPDMAKLPATAKPLTPEWMELWAFAIAEAKKNGVRLGFHNCPGWSSSGGPWIKPEDSMKVVVSSHIDGSGGGGEASPLPPEPPSLHGFYRDIAVVSIPLPAPPPRVVAASGDFGGGDFAAFASGRGALSLPLKKPGAEFSLTLEYDRPLSPKAAAFGIDDANFYADAVIEASPDGEAWTKIGERKFRLFRSPRTEKIVELGGAGVAASASGRALSFRFFRVRFKGVATPPWVRASDRRLVSLEFSELDRIPDNVDLGDWMVNGALGASRPTNAPSGGLRASRPTNAPSGGLGASRPTMPCRRLLRLGYTTTGQTCAPATLPGLECDKLSKRGLDAHWPHMPRRLLDAPGARETVTTAVIDSYEVGPQNWTDGFEREFAARRGYDITPYLPAVAGYVVGSRRETAKFLHDFRRTISELFAENYYDYFTELCHREGIASATEPYGGPFDTMRCGRSADVPTGEFWLGGNHDSPRKAASIAHLNGRGAVGAEAFTTDAREGRWQITPAQLRRAGDERWAEGVSQIIYHSYLHQPFDGAKPGISLGRHGTQLNRNTTWWPEGRYWADYVARGQTLLQAGRARTQILVLTGDSTPNDFPPQTAFLAAGYSFDWCGADDLARLVPDGRGGAGMPGLAPYEAVFLGRDRWLTLATLRAVARLADGGARIAGRKPLGSPSLSDDESEWQNLADALWDGGKVVDAPDALAAARTLGVAPDLRVEGADGAAGLAYIRRECGDCDVWFIVNKSDATFEGRVELRGMRGGAVEIWDAKTGEISPAPERLAIAPHKSMFLVRDGRAVCPQTAAVDETSHDGRAVCPQTAVRRVEGNAPYQDGGLGTSRPTMRRVEGNAPYQMTNVKCKMINGLWLLCRFRGQNPPEGEITLDALESWTESADPRLRYFSGRAVYEKRFSLDAADAAAFRRAATLDLGDVRDVANVRVNGAFAGCLWEPPYETDVSRFLREGENTLEIEVVNTWPNRMIGDAIARRGGASEEMAGTCPKWVVEGRGDSGTGIYTWSNFDGWKADEPLRPAGLLGPVTLRAGAAER